MRAILRVACQLWRYVSLQEIFVLGGTQNCSLLALGVPIKQQWDRSPTTGAKRGVLTLHTLPAHLLLRMLRWVSP